MKVGVRFCGGCNPRFDRGQALETIKKAKPEVDFQNAVENVEYDMILVIGGCTNCCAAFDHFLSRAGVEKMWDESHIDGIINNINIDQARIEK